ncbi:MAG TPA: DUF4382 domain-containing protein [Burkholderiaceae bacterium]|nr:DUF4382 domain-containing protein [Burkholderiaceae bacterium]
MNKRLFLKSAAAAIAFGTALGLAACGGGGSSGGSAAPQAATGKVTVAVTDAPSADFNQVWITIRRIDFNKAENATPNDPNWLSFPLAEPVTVDLAQLANGNMAEVFQDIELPVGLYRQIRLVLVGEDEPLTASALAAGLQYNDQVNFTGPTGVDRVAPLEIPHWRTGITVFGRFTVEQDKTLRLVLDFDIDNDVVVLPDALSQTDGLAFTLKPFIRYYDLDLSGAIVGRIDPATLSPAARPRGGYWAIVKAQDLSSDGSVHVVRRATSIRPDGSFTLFPVPVPSAGASKNYDITINGHNLQTSIVRGVPVVGGTTPTVNPTQLSAAPLAMATGTEYGATLSSPAQPTGSWINFYQTLPGATAPYQVRFRHVNPFNGHVDLPLLLPAGDLRVGDYVAGGAPVLSNVTPVEGSGGFSAIADAVLYSPGAPVLVTPPASGSVTTLAGSTLAVNAALAVPGTINLAVTTMTPGRYDKGQFVITRFGFIVDSVAIDSVLASGGNIAAANLPAGTSGKPLPQGVYFGYLRVWNSNNPLIRPRIVPIFELADLRTTNSASLAVTLP